MHLNQETFIVFIVTSCAMSACSKQTPEHEPAASVVAPPAPGPAPTPPPPKTIFYPPAQQPPQPGTYCTSSDSSSPALIRLTAADGNTYALDFENGAPNSTDEHTNGWTCVNSLKDPVILNCGQLVDDGSGFVLNAVTSHRVNQDSGVDFAVSGYAAKLTKPYYISAGVRSNSIYRTYVGDLQCAAPSTSGSSQSTPSKLSVEASKALRRPVLGDYCFAGGGGFHESLSIPKQAADGTYTINFDRWGSVVLISGEPSFSISSSGWSCVVSPNDGLVMSCHRPATNDHNVTTFLLTREDVTSVDWISGKTDTYTSNYVTFAGPDGRVTTGVEGCKVPALAQKLM